MCVCVLFLLWPWIGLIQKTMATLWFLTAQGHRSFETCLQNCKIPVPIPGRNLTCRSSLLEVGTIQDDQTRGECSWLVSCIRMCVHDCFPIDSYPSTRIDMYITKYWKIYSARRGVAIFFAVNLLEKVYVASRPDHHVFIIILFLLFLFSWFFICLNIRSPITPPKHGAVVVFQEMRRQREPMLCRCWFQATWRRRWLGFN